MPNYRSSKKLEELRRPRAKKAPAKKPLPKKTSGIGAVTMKELKMLEKSKIKKPKILKAPTNNWKTMTKRKAK
jgi:hypothetical protein